MKAWVSRLVAVVVIGAGSAGGVWYYRKATQALPPSYTKAQVKRDDIVGTISATGTIEPEEVVDVGAQVAGQIIGFGKDASGKTVDYGSAVTRGTVLARIDEALFQADVSQAEAQVKSAQAAVRVAEATLEQLKARLSQTEADAASAQAGVQRATADLGQLKARHHQADLDWQRAQKLGPSDALAKTTYDGYQSAYDVALANVAVGEASLLQAQAACDSARCASTMAKAGIAVEEGVLEQTKANQTQAETSLWRAKRNLEYCTITSPVDGVIIDRRVNIGQTVVASLNAPSLFLIAKDLKRLEVWVAVNEADIGTVRPGLPVTFKVDAFPGETFAGEVGTVRLNATMTQNVVTYTVEVVTDNASGKLLPYLTANAKFQVDHREGVLVVPNAALRWTPPAAQIAPDVQAANRSGGQGGASPGSGRAGGGTERGDRGSGAPQRERGTLWVQDGAYVRPVRVRVGLSDGAVTEVEGDKVVEGMDVIVAENRPRVVGAANGRPGGSAAAANGDGTTNPFAPRMPSRPR